MTRSPNILFITDDQHRWDFMSNQAVPSLKIPTLTRLRSEGTILSHGYANTPICLANRMTWTHGLYGSQVADGILHNWHAWPRHLPSMPQALQHAGYHTALIGKQHSQGRWRNDLTDPIFLAETKGRGYDDVMETCGKSFAHRVDCHWTHYLKDRGLLERYREDLVRRVESLGGDEPSDASFLEYDDHMDSFIGRHARKWLCDWQGEKPFYLHASYCGPHFPIDPPEDYHKRYDPNEMPLPVGVDDPERIRYWQRRTAAYCAMIEHVDHEIGLLLETLEERGWAENTLVIFGSDHGDMMGHHNLAHKGRFYDTSCRTPYILRWPGRIAAGRELDGCVESVDIPATIMDAAGLGADVTKYIDSSPGRSFLGYVTGENGEAPRDWAYAEMGRELIGGWRMCRERDWKYVLADEGDYLFDMERDPWETTNLIDDPGQAQRVSSMRRQLLESMRSCVAPSRWKIGEPTYVDGQYNW